METVLLFFALGVAGAVLPCNDPKACSETPLWHIPGPNPIFAPNPDSAWSNEECEMAASVLKEGHSGRTRYYLSTHCTGSDAFQYQDGFSISEDGPLGPWSKTTPKPQLSFGGNSSWDRSGVASLNVMLDPRNESQWLGWFEGASLGGPTYGAAWGLGLAFSQDGPMGPWKEYAKNPILKAPKSRSPKPGSSRSPRPGALDPGALTPHPDGRDRARAIRRDRTRLISAMVYM